MLFLPWFPGDIGRWEELKSLSCHEVISTDLSQTLQRRETYLCYVWYIMTRIFQSYVMYLCVWCIYVFMWIGAHMYLSACMYTQMEARSSLVFFFFFSTLSVVLLFLLCSDRASQWTWSSSLWPGCMDNELQGSVCLHGSPTPSSGITETNLHIQVGIQTLVLRLALQHFTDWAISSSLV